MKTFIIDSFTQHPFRGNPAAVCLTDQVLPAEFMLNVAQEFGFSETAFVLDRGTAKPLGIRYFSPKEEIPLCGHATLAAAKAIFVLDASRQRVDFVTQGDDALSVRRADGERLEMDFPCYGLEAGKLPEGMAEALGLEQADDCQVSLYNRETNILMLVANAEESVKSLAPDFQKLVTTHPSIAGVLVTAACVEPKIDSGGFDFCSRFFWPWSGTNENPVTGATHTFMGPFWAEKLGKTKLRSLQCSQRSGELDIEIVTRGDEKSVLITGDAVVMLSGDWIGGR